eukprot:scaffold78085_cov44-Tisochrysis_lutea.AAC.1
MGTAHARLRLEHVYCFRSTLYLYPYALHPTPYRVPCAVCRVPCVLCADLPIFGARYAATDSHTPGIAHAIA